jgi:hypothetical protein
MDGEEAITIQGIEVVTGSDYERAAVLAVELFDRLSIETNEQENEGEDDE